MNPSTSPTRTSPVIFPSEKRLGNCLWSKLLISSPNNSHTTAIQLLAKGLRRTAKSPNSVQDETRAALFAARAFNRSPSPHSINTHAGQTFQTYINALYQCSINRPK